MLFLQLLSSQSCFPVLGSRVCQHMPAVTFFSHLALLQLNPQSASWQYDDPSPQEKCSSIFFSTKFRKVPCQCMFCSRRRTTESASQYPCPFGCCIRCWGWLRECPWVRTVCGKGAYWLTPQNSFHSLVANSNNFQSLPVLDLSQRCLFKRLHNALPAPWTIRAFSLKLVRSKRPGGVKSQVAALRSWEY